MKVEIKTAVQQRTYPYLGKYVSQNGIDITYVKFVEPGRGVLIHTTRTNVGQLNFEWAEHRYVVTDDAVTVSNWD